MQSLLSLNDAAVAVEFSSSAVALILSAILASSIVFFFEATGSSGSQISVESYGSRNDFLFSSSVAEPIQFQSEAMLSFCAVVR